jgi:hypothetical protein
MSAENGKKVFTKVIKKFLHQCIVPTFICEKDIIFLCMVFIVAHVGFGCEECPGSTRQEQEGTVSLNRASVCR